MPKALKSVETLAKLLMLVTKLKQTNWFKDQELGMLVENFKSKAQSGLKFKKACFGSG